MLIFKIFRSDEWAALRENGEMAIVLVEQYFDFAFDLADQIIVLRRGEVVFSERKSATERNALLELVSV